MSRLKQLVTRLRRPDMREVAVAQVSDKYSEYPSNGLTPVKLAEILREADAGDVLRQMELFEEMEEKDPHLFSQLQTRKNAVTGLDFEVIPFGDEPLDKEIADFIEEQLNGIESFEDVENDLLDAIGKGFAVSEILWGYDEGHVVVQDIKTRHQKRFFWDTLDDSFKVRTKDVPEGILLPANKFIVHRYKARSGHTSRAGILRVVAWMYLFKNYDLKDWVSFAEIYGLPLRLGKYAPGASDSDKAALMRALIQIGSDAAGIIPDGTSIDFITTEKTSSSDLYERLARYCDEQISKAILGQTLTSDSGGGSYAQSKTHNDVRHDLTVADCKALASTLRRDLIRPLCIFNFGEDKRIPYIRFDCEESEDLTQTATILGTLIEKVGLRIPTSFVYKKFSIPEPEEGDEIAKPTYGGGMGGVLPFKSDALLSLKAGADAPIGTQQHIDRLAAAALHKGVGSFKRAFEPVLKMIENADSLEQHRELMEDDTAVAELYAAVAYFKERVPVTASRFYQIAAEYRALAFTVSGYTKAQVLKKFYDELLAALEEGNSLAEFRENMNDFLEAEGYEGITPYQAENIFRTNIQTAYNVGHYKRMTEPSVKALRPYWQYDAVNDSKTRPSHLAMDGRVFMADDPIWDTWFPPNGFKCRCTVKTLSKRQMEQRGLTVETEAPRAARLEDGRFVNILPDPQFDTNPAKVRYQPDLTGYPEPLKKAYQEREKGNTPP